MSRILDVGAGPSSDAEFQIDIFKWSRTTHVLDAMSQKWPFEDDFFDEVRMEQFLEHVPPMVYIDNKPRHLRVEVMKEAYRVLKRGGMLVCSVPNDDDAFCQDPTHVGPKWIEGTFNYFCGQWGGNEPGSFSNDAYGINFAFKKIEAYLTGWILTVKLQKP